ncbi:DNA integrity scanning diadenylate cyclase DisA [Mechercharimyces sp. CAU 1602]|uniref:DNA integrity scanning diadenylate cyclase DisA n=1 Tax=Mechercharimyces sp. CAU 1602 TaxID=2973933 RepID=UPI002161E27E|nr:DNA integrity scanning diadenylate cyclase DisA [Mechercharimyces sp. CAU 1602]MCS1352504.1 DNA integrity scanning diadenylate cyclase DisA [Mechercharimyces sp. CAU 1602]
MKEDAAAERRNTFVSEILRLVAPGTPFREGLDNVLGAKTGALIVMGYDECVSELVDGGFHIDSPFTPAHLYELAKMDGAIILSNDGRRILYANAQLVPSSTIPSTETGIRHRTAQRTARQTGKLVISISQRRSIITLYQGHFRYALKDIGVILTKANQAIQTLDKYKSVLDQSTTNLSALEFEELVTLNEVAMVMQRVEMVLRIKGEIESYIHELGTEGRLIKMQLDELVDKVEEETVSLIKDYSFQSATPAPREVLHRLKQLSQDELLDHGHIVKALGFPFGTNIPEETVSPRGYRILHKIPRLPQSIIQNLIGRFESLPRIMMATIEELDEVEGIGEVRARTIKEGLKRIQEQVFIDRHI